MTITLTATTATDLIDKAQDPDIAPSSIFQLTRYDKGPRTVTLEYADPDTAGKADDIARALHITDPQQVDELRYALWLYDDDQTIEAFQRLTGMGITVHLTIIPDTPPTGDDNHTH
ncbi:hypothetical protein CSQ85_12275 [Bifidobacterium rousetti]|uniref:hypothetical protein n=1 Tax=Bifidobacterium rousetti TaxID=2045439 RepID=UPI001238EDEA|nr:hypothetical protein [Bifidobacterium rousetti]KAA8815698.1 hypothetical protein CSQ85_12275 [Bifidobacterium rousetti]